MLDLTFGEQVKIILSRKGMTIKELAETIEARTGKKMSRQNLTQRLGRDNFQEQDMRMIAEILGCPFQLSILGENIPTERTYNNIEDREEMPVTEAEYKKIRTADVGGQEAGKDSAMTHERDITIGELVDINEELDAMMENAALSSVAETGADDREEGVTESGFAAEEKSEENVQSEMPEEEREETYVETYAEPEEAYAEVEEVYAMPEQESVENVQAEMSVLEDADTTGAVIPDEAVRVKDEAALAENGTMSVEEKKEEPEKKTRGWRAYLKRRKKKQEPSPQEEHHAAERSEDIERAEILDDVDAGEVVHGNREREAYAQGGYKQEEHSQDGYEQEAYTQDGYEPEEYPQDGYAESYSKEGYVAEGYQEEGYTAEENYQEEGYIEENDPKENYTEENYSEEGCEQETYAQEAYEQEQEVLEEEEDLVNGDVNPYTGREYQSNSVRMHPSRIGYVQVYDRSIHAWTDMTEWAFLGYQERKKVLLGKDYDPPIYLD